MTWSSDNTAGKVTAVVAGTATITATSGNASATCTVTVSNKKLTLAFDPDGDGEEDVFFEIEYTNDDTWKDIANKYSDISLKSNPFGPTERKIVTVFGAELKSAESSYNYELVNINDKVSAYNTYYLKLRTPITSKKRGIVAKTSTLWRFTKPLILPIF